LAGVPDIMESMLKFLLPSLKHGALVRSLTHTVMIGESKIAERLENLQNKYRSIDIGSYPFTKDGIHGTSLVLRSSDYLNLDKAFNELTSVIQEE
jgi:molybdopterin-biosynthesis enzyme MoeA-like protein